MDFIALDNLLKENMPRVAKGKVILLFFRTVETDYDHEKIIELALKHRLMQEAQIMRFSILKLAEAMEVNLNATPYLGLPDESKKPPHETVGEGLY